MAVLAFVLAFVFAPVAIWLGFIARGQIRRTGESGRGLATAGLVLGTAFTVVGIATAAFVAGAALKAAPAVNAPPPTLNAPPPPTINAEPPSLDAGELARTLTGRLESQGVKPTEVTCPSDLRGRPWETVRCAVLVGDQPADVIVTVTSVDGGSIHYDYRIEARPIAQPLLERKVAELVAQNTGTTPGSASCASDLPPIVGQYVECSLRVNGETVAVTVTVTGTNGGQINFSVAQK